MEIIKNLTPSHIIISLSVIIAGLFLAKIARLAITRLTKDSLSQHHSLLLQRIVYYTIVAIFLFTALQQIGINLGVILGAAGILSVALGFASQTSASNVISGLFLLGEKPFAVSDVIKVGTTTGEVISIDLLSVKLRTFDNLFVRIPNETIIKSEVTTITRFPIRRFDLPIGVAYKEDLARVTKVLMDVANELNSCLEEPAPQVFILGFGDSAINLQFSVWAKREEFFKFKNTLIQNIKIAFDNENIEIPFPHRTIYTGSITAPFPISQVNTASAAQDKTTLS